MTRDQAEERVATLYRKREEVVDAIAAVDVNSATVSAGGSSKSYTNRSVADMEAKLKRIDREIERLETALGRRPGTDAIGGKSIYPKYVW